MSRAPLALVLALAAAGCATARPREPDAVVRLQAPPGAEVYVDGALVGLVSPRGAIALGLRAGDHRLELRAAGRFPAYRDLAVRKGERSALAVEPRPDLDRTDGEPAPR